MESHLLQMRGLKQRRNTIDLRDHRSHLLQMRGLKPAILFVEMFVAKSHLLQMRGLKHPYQKKYQYNNRRIFYRCVD